MDQPVFIPQSGVPAYRLSHEAKAEIDQCLETAILEGVFPGAVLRVQEGCFLHMEKACGLKNVFTRQKMTAETFFDLASLTKPLCTAICAFKLVEENRLSMDTRVHEVIPEFRAWQAGALSLRQLLTHTSGLPAYRPFFLVLKDVQPEAVRKDFLNGFLKKLPLLHPPGEKMVYSDPGYMLVQKMIETITGLSLDRWAKESVCQPSGTAGLHFPGASPKNGCTEYAATELCPWRGRLLCGEVHDDNAACMGGVAGHAGLFGRAEDVGGLCGKLYETFCGKNIPGFLAPQTVQNLLARDPVHGRTPGFDVPSRENSQAGSFFSKSGAGHLGYTGTSFWMDLKTGVTIILLTNRVHPTRYNSRIKDFRPKLHDLVMKSLDISEINVI